MVATTKDAYRLLHEGAVTLAQISANGIRVDTDYLNQAITDIDEKTTTLIEELYADELYKVWKKKYGGGTKLRSREQLGDILYNVLKHPIPAVTESGRPSTDEEALRKINLPFVQKYLKVEKYHKAKKTYLLGLQQEIVDGLLHPTFNLHTVTTFRSSSGKDKEEDRASRDFNFQNIPNRNPEIAEIVRRCFVPRKGRIGLEIDYSQLEVRISCPYHKDPVLMAYVNDPKKCMHRDTACRLFGLPQEQVEKKTTRDWSKNRFVFPQFYGSVYFQCAPSIWEGVTSGVLLPGTKTTVQEHLAKQGIKELGPCDPQQPAKKGTFEYRCKEVEQYFWNEMFKVYSDWKRKWYNAYLGCGEFSTLTGFRIQGIYSRNDVINYPIQGAAFHCLLQSLILLHKWLKKHKMQTMIVGQIHDSMILDATKDELDEVVVKATAIMTEEVPNMWRWINVPLAVEAEVFATNWYEKKEYKS